MLQRHILCKFNVSTSFRSISIKGRATEAATSLFVSKSKLNLYHQFEKSRLYINPIIHGSPRFFKVGDEKYIDMMSKKAILKNRSNCVVVYDYSTPGKPWHTDILTKIITPKNNIIREEIVTVANLGLAASESEILRRLSDASELSGLECLDMAFFEIDESVLARRFHNIGEASDALQSLCDQGRLHSFGVKISVAPYTHHSPTQVITGPNLTFPAEFEQEVFANYGSYLDLILYNVSPTVAYPATFPMLSASEDSVPEEKPDPDLASEQTRMFTRIGCDPLIGRRGTGVENSEENDADEQSLAEVMEHAQKVQEMMHNVEKRKNPDAHAFDENAPMTDKEMRMIATGVLVDEKGKEDGNNENTTEDQGQHEGEGGAVEETDEEKMARETAEIIEEAKRNSFKIDELPPSQMLEPTSNEKGEVVFITGMMDPHIESSMAVALDTLCPALSTTPKLQDKALRTVFSVGIDAVLLDAELSAMMGKVTLTKNDVLSSDDTLQIFSGFILPENLFDQMTETDDDEEE